uniref:Putative secreted protein n=1 Tax=Panstrongylus lignarius TaxID=156445 RepID=A0A224XTQ1_9HEMI
MFRSRSFPFSSTTLTFRSLLFFSNSCSCSVTFNFIVYCSSDSLSCSPWSSFSSLSSSSTISSTILFTSFIVSSF